MSNRHKQLFLREKLKGQQGQAFLILVVILVLGTATAIYGFVSSNKLTADADQKTATALAQAKEALIGYAVNNSARPGALPCPNRDLLPDGTPSGQESVLGLCDTPSIGYLPWRTLGLPELRDGNGELLWYAVSANFKNRNSATDPVPLNSDTLGEFTVTGTTTASNVIAIVFAPGATLDIPGQQQDRTKSQTAPCSTTGTTIARVLCAANYLEGGNHDGDTNFISSLANTIPQASDGGFNDKLILITKESLFPPVENRVARDLRTNLQSYYNINHYYPFAAPLNGTTCQTGNYPAGTYRGRVPTSCPDLAPFTPPSWFTPNRWDEVMIYGVAPRCTPRFITTTTPDMFAPPSFSPSPNPGQHCIPVTISIPGPPPFFPFIFTYYNCYPYQTTTTLDPASPNYCNNPSLSSPDPYLEVINGSDSVHAIIAPAGYQFAGQSPARTAITDYLEITGGSSENIDTPDNFIYAKPTRSSSNNDSLLQLP